MFSADIRRIARARRDAARGPLRQLLEHAAYRGLSQMDGLLVTEVVLRRALDLVQEEFDKLADAGALAYFGIRDSAELGDLPVDLIGIDEHGTLRADVGQAVNVILSGAARREGWMAPKRLTMEDMER